MTMIRAQIRLHRRDYAIVKREAKAASVSIAEYIRRAIRISLPPRRGRRGCILPA
jgi:hypothetical protein